VSNDSGLAGRLESLHAGHKLALVVVVAFVLFVGASWATAPPQAPDIDDSDGGDGASNFSAYDEHPTLIGLQGPFNGQEGYAQLITGDDRPSLEWQSEETWANFDVSPLPGDRVLTAFIVRDASPTQTGFRIYDGANDTIEREWTFPVRSSHNSEVHDVEMLPNGEVVVVDMDRERVFTVDEAGEITWQWNASERYTPPSDVEGRDWLHMNDVDRISEDRYLVSVRNANQLLILERGEGVVEVINEDDGGSEDTCMSNSFGDQNRLVPGDDDDVLCGNPDVIREQHNPQWLDDGRVLVADSDNNRVTELRKQDGEWRPVLNYTGAGGTAFDWPRDADKLENGNILVTDTRNSRVVEITPNGSMVWGVNTEGASNPYEADRLPEGEYPSGLSNVSDGTVTPGGSNGPDGRIEIPVVTLAFNALVGSVALPHWITQWHLLGLIVTLLSGVIGTVWAYWDGR
jgi:hypothetical protein